MWQQIENVADQDLTIENDLIPVADEGTPQEKLFAVVEKAQFILNLENTLAYFKEDEQLRIRRLAQIYQNSIQGFYVGRNQMTQQMKTVFAQTDTNTKDKLTIDEIVRSEKFYLETAFIGGFC